MRLFKLEVERLLMTRRIKVLILLSVFFTIIMAYLPITFENITYINETGNEVEIEGVEAVKYKKELQGDIEGVVTTEKVQFSIKKYQECLQKYAAKDTFELPRVVYDKELLPYAPLIKGAREILADSSTGIAPSVGEIELDQLDNYYYKCEEWIASLMQLEQKENVIAQDIAVNMYRNVEKPYEFYSGITKNAVDYEVLLIFLLLFFCVIIVAPIFSTDYQTGADDLFRCTKYGRGYLGLIKTISAVVVCSILFIVCIVLHIVISYSLFGWESAQSSIQMLYSSVNLADFNMGELQVTMIIVGLVSLLATICVTLFFSSRNKNVIVSLTMGLLLCIAPLLVYMIIPEKIGLWIRCILPSGSVGLQTSFLYELLDFQFLSIGDISIWTPYLMLIFASIEIPLFFGLTVFSYLRYKSN